MKHKNRKSSLTFAGQEFFKGLFPPEAFLWVWSANRGDVIRFHQNFHFSDARSVDEHKRVMTYDDKEDAYLFFPILQQERHQWGFCRKLPSLALSSLALQEEQNRLVSVHGRNRVLQQNAMRQFCKNLAKP